MICYTISSNILSTAVLLGLMVVSASCGDLQDLAPGAPTQSGLSEAELIEQSTGGSEESRTGQQDGNTSSSVTLSALALAAAASSGEARSVIFGWDPSVSEGVLGYKVHLIAVSTAVERIIDVGPATALAVPLKIGEIYGFTVTAYNSSMESPELPYMLFQAF